MRRLKKLLIIIVLTAILVVIVAVAIKNKPDMETASIQGVIINEVMTKNDSSCPDEFDEYPDWVELCNTGNKPANISGCGLSDNLTEKVKYVFPKGTIIEPNGFLVVYCAGEKLGDYYAEFKLSTSDQMVLYDHGGNPIESISLKSVAEGMSIARESITSKEWVERLPSPGYPNTDEGIAAYAESIQSRSNGEKIHETGDIIISELMASNATTIPCKDGQYFDWVELYNKSDKQINLKDWSVSDDAKNLKKYVFSEDITIDPGQYLLLFCSGQAGVINEEIHVPFGLRAYEESFVIVDSQGKTSDKVTFSRQKTDISFARNQEGEYEQTAEPTPGYPNTDEGYNEFLKTALVPQSDIYITELMGANSSFIFNLDGKKITSDFIEIYNSSSNDINLAGYALSNKPTNPVKWVFPDITIRAGKYLTILANSAKESQKGGYLQANFSISSLGDTVYLFSPDGSFLNKLHAKSFIKDMSVGLNKNNKLCYYSTPTPNEQNSKEGYYLGQTETPKFSVTPGIYSDTVTLSLSTSGDEKIYYTTDCTVPTTKSKLYEGPITITENTVIRAKSFKNDYYNKFSCASGTYLFTTDECNHSLPVVTLVTDPDNLWDGKKGIYAYGDDVDLDDDQWPYWQTDANFWKDIEVPASFEVFNDSGKQAFQQNIGIRITGAFGQGREQKGFAVTARDEYGSSRMRYKFFADQPFTEYKSIILRCGAQDQLNAKIRDVVTADLLKDSPVNFLYQDYKPYVLYLNGRYWGVYFMREKRNRFFVAQHAGNGLENADKLTLVKSETRANYGTTDEWKSLMDYARTHDLTNDSNYKYLCDRLNIDSFIDYMACEVFVAQSDYWNIQMYKTTNGKWNFIFYDFCWSWSNYEHETLKARRAPAQPCSDLFNACLKRSDFRDKYIRRCAYFMDNVFTQDRMLASVDKLYNMVKSEIPRERSIFNTSPSAYSDLMPYIDRANLSSYEHFEREVEKMRTFAKNRRANMISQFKKEFNLSDSYIKEVFGNG